MYEARQNKVPIQRTLSLSKKKESKSCLSKKSIINNSFRNNLDNNRNYPILQRLQLVSTKRGDVEADVTVLNNIRFAKEINAKRGVANEKICSLCDDYSMNDLDTEHKEIIFVHGHGAPGMFLGEDSLTFYKAAKIIYKKLNPKDNEQIEIRMLSCYGGESMPNFGDNGLSFPEAMKKINESQNEKKKKMKVSAIIGAGVSHGGSGISFTPQKDNVSYGNWLKEQRISSNGKSEKSEKSEKSYLEAEKELEQYALGQKNIYNQSKDKLKDEYYKNVFDTAENLLPFISLNKLIALAYLENELKVATLNVYDSTSNELKQETPLFTNEIEAKMKALLASQANISSAGDEYKDLQSAIV